ncbi:cyanophycin synthetase [Desulfitobacterium dichloroeliminans LMG P-21439]|uniref:Cyanophycin synthetase n=1 Tax=Desulfitobacterium dichloroeliminans (strain LMG P-21439 / DCA1) TaxID=871963 RepID=L0F3W5_DESDL|nr:cyanophycin synthetase [Desulfitobacterium dichloroeliminans]AGA67623.1 cyanophycin synthetase [Desulfitobacterium dichloroeliminans LMG P-21439]
MEILKIQAIPGANVYSYRPVIRAVVDLQEWTERTSDTLGDFNTRLVQCLPTLYEHYCSRGKPGGFLERLKEGTLVGHIIEHVTIELLTRAGQNIPYGKTLCLPENPGQYEIIFNYDSLEGGVEAFKQGYELVLELLSGSNPNVTLRVERIMKVILQHEIGSSTRAIMEAAKGRDIPVMRLNDSSLLQLGYGRNQRRVQAAMSHQTSCIGVDIACDKGLTKKLLYEGGIPVPQGIIAETEDEAVEGYRRLAQLVVVKPYNGNQGKGVTLKLKTEAEVRAAFRVAQTYGDRVVIEEYIEGKNYRLLIVDGKMVAAAERIPAHVLGDGASTIEELVRQANADPKRGEDHEKALTKIKIDPVVLMTLTQKNLTLATIPTEGEVVYLRDSANLSTGGISVDVTDRVHPDNAALAEYAARIVGLDIAGVDLVLEDIAQSYREQSGAIIEVNAAPGLRMHQSPTVGKPLDVGEMIVDHVMPAGNGRIPIIAITGTNGKTTTTRMIGKMLKDRSLSVGMTTTDGIYVGGKLLLKGDTTGPESARIVLRHPDVQVALLETARGGILRAGLAYDYADVAVITNVANDHLGQYGMESLEDIAHVKSLIAEVVRPHSYVVLNADDPRVVSFARKTKGKVIFFSTEKDNLTLRKHLAVGGIGVFVRRGNILLCQGDQSHRICGIKDLPVTWNGRAHHNIQNALAAIAVGWALGLKAEGIRTSLMAFTSDSECNRGRLNSYVLNDIQVFIDYGHNASGIKAISETLRKFKAPAVVGCITVPGDRPDASIREVARVAARGFHRLIIREDRDLRGRRPGEIAGILMEEAIASGMDPRKISVVLPEREAFCHGLDTCAAGEIFVMFYEHLESIEEEITQRLKCSKLTDEGFLELANIGGF